MQHASQTLDLCPSPHSLHIYQWKTEKWPPNVSTDSSAARRTGRVIRKQHQIVILLSYGMCRFCFFTELKAVAKVLLAILEIGLLIFGSGLLWGVQHKPQTSPARPHGFSTKNRPDTFWLSGISFFTWPTWAAHQAKCITTERKSHYRMPPTCLCVCLLTSPSVCPGCWWLGCTPVCAALCRELDREHNVSLSLLPSGTHVWQHATERARLFLLGVVVEGEGRRRRGRKTETRRMS